MIAYAEALALLRELSSRKNLSTETVPINQAVGSILAKSYVSPIAVPSFDNSAMDGFAVRWNDIAKASPENLVELRLAGTIAAGDAPPTQSRPTDSNLAWEIMTGAAIPSGYDTVLKLEDVTLRRDPTGRLSAIIVRHHPTENRFIRQAGEDFEIGTRIGGPGLILQPEHALALATIGISKVEIFRKVRFGVLSTGSEIVSPENGKVLNPGQIFNSTSPYLMSALSTDGATAKSYGSIGDNPGYFMKKIDEMLSDGIDVIVTTGAVSMGRYDFIVPALKDRRAEILFHKVAIRPGKPLLLATESSGAIFLGLPGNPISTVVGFRFFVEPFLRGCLRRTPERPWSLKVRYSTAKPEGLRCFYKARLDLSENSAEILEGQASFMVSPLMKANGWVILAEEGTEVSEGEIVEAVPLHPLPYEGERSL